MKFKQAVVLGMGFYLGHEIMKCLDEALGREIDKRGLGKKISNKIRETCNSENEDGNKIVGFHV